MAEDFMKQLYDYVDVSVRHHLENADNLKDFLTFVAGFHSNVSTRNKILTYGYNPRAADIKTKEGWEKQGIQVTDENAVIYNIQQNKNGGFSERIMYDVSATDDLPDPFESFPDAGFFAERLILYPPCPIRFREPPLTENRKASYEPEKGIIEVTSGFRNEEQVCHGLLREFAHFYLHENEMQMAAKNSSDTKVKTEYDRDRHGIEAQAVSYAVCTRYRIETPKLDVVHPPEGKPKDMLRVLEGLDKAIQKISKLIDDGAKDQRRFIGQGNTADNAMSQTGAEDQPRNKAPTQGRG